MTNAPDRIVVLHDYSQALGGASYLVQVLIRELREAGLPVTFFTGDDGANFPREDVELIALGEKPLLERSRIGALTSGFHLAKAAARLQAWIAANDTPRTIYHVNGWSKILTPAIFGPLRSVAQRVVLHGHDYFNGCPNGGYFNFQTGRDCPLVPLSARCLGTQCDKSGYVQKLWRSAREGSRRIQAGGVGAAARLLMIHPGQEPGFRRAGWDGARLHAVTNPVEPPVAHRVQAESNAGVLFIGRISAEKGADLAAAAAVRANVPITFVGDGDQMDKVRAINPEARMLGRLDRAGVAAALGEARMAVMPSRWSEPFGLVALEAAGSGVPVIVSERALIGPDVASHGFGLSLNTDNIGAFASAIRQLSRDDAGVTAMSKAGHSRYGELCNTEASWAARIREHYGTMLI